MADNNYKEGNNIGDNYPYTNPYAKGGVVKLQIEKTEGCQYLASFSYVVAAGGATLTATALTGHLSANLKYYIVEVSDGVKTVAGQASLAAPAVAFVVNTSTLEPSNPWTIQFSGCQGGSVGDAGCSLQYAKELGVIGIAGGSGDTIPSANKWHNIDFRLMLESTDDANFTGFPSEGVDIADGGSININDYLASGITTLTNGKVYKFKLQAKQITQAPVASTPTPANNDAYASFASTVAFPYAIPKAYTELLNALTIKTTVNGVKSGVMTFAVANEGVKPTVSFTINTEVAV